MSIRNRLPKKKSAPKQLKQIPEWVKQGSETTKLLYETATNEYQRILNKIKANKIKNKKDSGIVLARVADFAGKHRSILSPRRQPELCDWIHRKNMQLDELYKTYTAKRSFTKPKSKRELEHTIALLRKEVKKLKEVEVRSVVEEFFNSNLLDDRDKMAREISRLRLEQKNLIDKITSLQHHNKNMSKEIANLHQLKIIK